MVSSEIMFGSAIIGIVLVYGIYEYATMETPESLGYTSFSRYMNPNSQYDTITNRYPLSSNTLPPSQGGSRRNRRKNRKTRHK